MAVFDPYHKWLGIPPADQPANHYRLLGLNLFESDPDVIDVATEQRVVYLRQCATGQHIAESQKLLNEVAAARLCLLNVEIKRLYDQRLRMTISSSHDSEQLDSATESVGDNGAATDDRLSQHSNQPRSNHILTAWQTATGRARFVIVTGPLLLLAALVNWLVSDPMAHESFAGATAGQERDDNSLKMKFCWCPPDTFTMGSPKSETGRAADEDQVPVALTHGFWIGKFEVTQDEWRQLMGTTIREQFEKRSISVDELRGEGARLPMYFISHDESREFCRKLTEQEHHTRRLPKDWEFRLPTEAEWEYACRAGTTTATAFGNILSSTQANFDGEQPYNGGTFGSKLNRTIDVGSYKPNAWGLCDMHGNLWEWCLDIYSDKLIGGRDPAVLESSTRSEYVLRGGGWLSKGERCRSAFRFWNTPSYRYNYAGFRVAAVQQTSSPTDIKPKTPANVDVEQVSSVVLSDAPVVTTKSDLAPSKFPPPVVSDSTLAPTNSKIVANSAVPDGPLQDVARRINAERQQRGLKSLTHNDKLTSTAQSQANWMAQVGKMESLRGKEATSFEAWKRSDHHPVNRVIQTGYIGWQEVFSLEIKNGQQVLMAKPDANDRVGEIIAHGAPNSGPGRFDPSVIVAGWMNSPGNQKRILTAPFEEFGVGFTRTPRGDAFWCVVFGKK